MTTPVIPYFNGGVIEGKNMRTLILCVILVSSLGVAVGQNKQHEFITAERDTGNDFYFDCPSSYKQWVETEANGTMNRRQAWCVAYTEGFVSGYNYSNLLWSGTSGPSSPLTKAQIYNIVAQYIIQHPEKRSENLQPLMFEALKPHFPAWKP